MKYSKRSPMRRFLSSPIALAGAFLVLVFLVRAIGTIHGKVAESERRLAEARAQYQRLSQRQSTLAEQVGYLSTPEGQEAEVRTKYHGIRDGESLAVIVDDGSPTASSSQVAALGDAAAVAQSQSWWRKLLGMIGL